MVAHAMDVRELIDRSPMRSVQYWTFATCLLIAIMDGYDLAVIGVAGPALIVEGLVDPRSFGYVASAGLAGFVPGMVAFGPAADRWGRKRVLSAAVILFALGSLLSGLSGGLAPLLLSRFVTGIGIGGAAPCFVSLAAEYSPHRLRTTVVTTLWAGVPAGGVLGGAVAARLMDAAGWAALFFFGALVPIVAVVVLASMVPESLEYLALRGGQDERIRAILRRIAPGDRALETATFEAVRTDVPRSSVRSIFKGGRGRTTLALWLAFFCAFGQLVMISQYAAVLLRTTGMPSAQIGTVFSSFFIGSVAGTIAAGPIMKRMSHTMATMGLLAAAALGSVFFGVLAGEFATALIGITVAGFTAAAGIGALVALATELYPPPVRGPAWVGASQQVGSARR